VCSHTLEDVRDPIWVGAELQRVAAAGYIEVPCLREELTYGIQGPWVGWGHHRWLVIVDTEQLDPSFVGRRFDAELLADLPAGVDPCGENGEFHTFVDSGPVFAAPIPVEPGELRDEGRFAYRDLLPS